MVKMVLLLGVTLVNHVLFSLRKRKNKTHTPNKIVRSLNKKYPFCFQTIMTFPRIKRVYDVRCILVWFGACPRQSYNSNLQNYLLFFQFV